MNLENEQRQRIAAISQKVAAGVPLTPDERSMVMGENMQYSPDVMRTRQQAAIAAAWAQNPNATVMPSVPNGLGQGGPYPTTPQQMTGTPGVPATTTPVAPPIYSDPIFGESVGQMIAEGGGANQETVDRLNRVMQQSGRHVAYAMNALNSNQPLTEALKASILNGDVQEVVRITGLIPGMSENDRVELAISVAGKDIPGFTLAEPWSHTPPKPVYLESYGMY
jgi:hypothetical protein